jgi:hypothetical protein
MVYHYLFSYGQRLTPSNVLNFKSNNERQRENRAIYVRDEARRNPLFLPVNTRSGVPRCQACRSKYFVFNEYAWPRHDNGLLGQNCLLYAMNGCACSVLKVEPKT